MNFKFIFIIVFTFHLNHLSAQFSEVGLNSGIIQTDIRGGVKGRTNKDCNSLKTGWIFSVNIDYKIKNWLKIKGIVNYQERKALETFTFPTKGNSGIGIHTFCKYPTSPQSDIYNPNIYKHFPNFKYVGIE
ncbi:MAG TPA: hypothetical protein ENJ53_06090, partial [Phaeodactylibacter sp.]|nr:hypothetical protein [Phaeodactylibacter sp.]